MDAIDAAAAVTRRYRMETKLWAPCAKLASLTWQSAMQVKVAVSELKKDVHGGGQSEPSRERRRRCPP